MKKYFLKLAFVALCAGTLISCDEDTVTYGGDNFVSFDDVANTNIQFFENAGISETLVYLAFPKSTDVIVNFTVTSDVAVEGTDYVVLTPGSVTIPAGSTSAPIKIQVMDNDVMDDSKPLSIAITGTNDGTVVIGLTDEGSKNKRLLIVNDDCTTSFQEFFGNLNAASSGSNVGTAVAKANENGDCNVLLVKGQIAYNNNITMPSADYITFRFTPGANKDRGTIDAYQQIYCIDCINAGGAPQNVLFSATGNYTTVGGVKRLTINGVLTLEDGRDPGPSTVALTVPN